MFAGKPGKRYNLTYRPWVYHDYGKKYGSVAEMVLTLAAEHGISSELDRIDNMVITFSRLSGNDVELDDIEILLAHLARKNVISQEEVFSLLEEYLNESKS